MDSIEKAKIRQISESINQLLQGKIPTSLTPLPDREDLNKLTELVNDVINSFAEIHEFILPLSKGILKVDPPKTKNLMASPFKELHSQLKTLTWQVQQIAKGDYKQRVDFMGEFSKAFNNLVENLAEKDRLVKKQIKILEQEAIRLRESEKRYSLALEHSPGGVFILDPVTKKVLEFNVQLENILGYSREELKQMSYYDFYLDHSSAEIDLGNIINKTFYVIKSRKLKKKNGQVIEADIQTYWSVGVTSSVIIINIQDVTKRNQAEQILSKYKILLEEVKDIIVFCDTEGRILEANKEAERAYGYTNHELRKMTIYDLFACPDKEILERKLKEACSYGIVYEAVNLRKNNSTFPVEVSARGSVVGGKSILANIIRDISERKKIEDELRYLATHDPLTRIANRYVLEETIAELISNQSPGTLLLLDVDNFKLINDTFGHAEGDKLLIDLVTLTKQQLGKKDIMARIGGDEFAILFPKTEISEAKVFAERLRNVVAEKIKYPNQFKTTSSFTISIGVTAIDSTMFDVNEIMAQANFALYQAKEQGRNRVVCLTCEQKNREKFKETNKIIRLISDAAAVKRFVLYFQPIYNMESGEITHHEGLLRLLDDSNNIIPPSRFIPIAERFGLMAQIDKHVIKLAFEALDKYPDLHLFINISGGSLGEEYLFNYIKENILASGIEPQRIGFEITETAAIKDLPHADRWIKELKKIGCCFAIDDFGIGFSTFSYLQYLPVDYVKIDGSYVRELDRNDKHRALVQAINTVAVSLGKKTIAEFVEDGSVMEVLKELKINHVQGHYIGKPEPVPVNKVNIQKNYQKIK
jgi:diguanylate cyclase (GGDEF)-like protein/PAS domain S-box-containing protein